jgi:hypothetical protein
MLRISLCARKARNPLKSLDSDEKIQENPNRETKENMDNTKTR